MNRPLKIDLNGYLTLMMNHHHVEIECAGREIKLFFTSFKSMTNFISCYRNLKKNHSYLIRDYLNHFDLTYYLGNKLVGESNSTLPISWLGNYIGMEKSRFHFSPFLSYFFSRKE